MLARHLGLGRVLSRPCATAAATPGRATRHRMAAAPRTIDSAAGAQPAGPISSGVEVTIEKLHASPSKLVLYVTGGAAQSVSWLLSVPGASRTMLEVKVPYSTSSLAEVLGHEPEAAYASSETAAELARAAYRQAANLSEFGAAILGVGCTCALTTDREKRGEHKAFVVAHTGTQERTYELRLAKGSRSRLEEDTLASKLVIRAVADSAGVGSSLLDLDQDLDLGSGMEGDESQLDELQVHVTSVDPAGVLRELLNGRVDTVEFSGGSIVVDAPRHGRVYLPGSFNPLHQGHHELLAAACRLRRGAEGCYEMSVGNADKGFMPLPEIERRVAQFVSAGLPVVVTQAPLFTQKADLFPGSAFVVGYDTAVRLVRAEYYGTDTAMLLQFAKLRHQGCSFLVAGRQGPEGRFLTLADIEVPELLQRGGLFEEVPEAEFRMDISSTELRSRGLGLQ